ncbi:MAG: cystathionine beta-lyase [Achromobacter sp.]|jgi:cystathionine beta-lyase|uniref:Cystathionine beta-lyase MetC n=6 Tax=Bacteria TaxID=2 RepID=A0A6J5B2N5_9BURK|nr:MULTISPECIES: cystathionine beta-lyase [Achromobacter]MBN9638420.1 cystathionine beta-lyase [Achromobacter sp.]CAB3689426.1 Cystathionine beta-lyase MetC [Achromobacter insuavis]CUI95091.1 Cystathionine beta-lyase metC [Achromobacter sp. 2789STDY5608633]CUJ14205.1 Cystathionine beta-lyase metC [Achromobacter sp. 2789STDY5608621]CUJ21508.1 Cystathionine beta-lyase metC [Achromobacter sp. 2789STDY5608628]
MKAINQTNRDFASLSPSVQRASTVVFDSLDAFVNRKHRQPDGFSYGVTGTPTARLLEDRIAALEGGRHCVITPSGAAALMTVVMGFVRGGDHLLLSAACYGALKTFGEKWLAHMGVDVELYDPSIGAGIEALIRPATRMICIEAPGTVTMEMADVPAIAAAARRHGVLTMMDNTWASPLGFQPLAHGVDFSVEAATKFFGGHSDVLMGSISMNDAGHYAVLRETQSILGQQVSPDDCFLVLRGLETLALRLRAQSDATLRVAEWLQSQPQVERLLYPPLPSDPGHALWRRDFRTNGCLFSMVLAPAPEAAFNGFFDSLRHFAIGASWGGVHSLAAYYPAGLQAGRAFPATDRPIVRLSIGLEDVDTLKDDLRTALAAYQAQR